MRSDDWGERVATGCVDYCNPRTWAAALRVALFKVQKGADMFHRLAGGISQSPQSGTSSAIRGRLSRLIGQGRIGAAVALTAATIGVGLYGMDAAWSQVRVVQDQSVQGRQISVTRDKSRTIKLDKPFVSALVGAPDVADVLPMSDRVMYVQGKKVGTTNVTLFDQDKNVIGVIGLEVTIDVQDVASKIHAGTESPGIRVSSNHNRIVLSGEARNAVDAEKAVSIARGNGDDVPRKERTPKKPEKYVVNAMRIAASQQVMLRVRFVEVSRQAERDLGVNWFGANASGSRGINTGKGVVTQAGSTIQQNTPLGPGTTPTSTPGGLPCSRRSQHSPEARSAPPSESGFSISPTRAAASTFSSRRWKRKDWRGDSRSRISSRSPATRRAFSRAENIRCLRCSPRRAPPL